MTQRELIETAWSALQDLWDQNDMLHSESYWHLRDVLKELYDAR